jgi:uracil-DNA glycosylase
MPSARPSTTSSTASEARLRDEARLREEARFRRVFRRAHADHAACREDEWLMQSCRLPDGTASSRPLVWSRRNGPWRRVPVLFVGAAPGNAGGRGRGERGAHGTRIPFGGDVAGANLDALLAAVGLDRNHTFIVASLNQLPERGGGEPGFREIAGPVGEYASSAHLLRDTIVAAGPALIVALGNLGLRTTLAAAGLDESEPLRRLPSLTRIQQAGIRRGVVTAWPDLHEPSVAFAEEWARAWPGSGLPRLLLCWHPSAQNMSPFAGADTVFHHRMVETRDALRSACAALDAPVARAAARAAASRSAETSPDRASQRGGIYSLPEWIGSIAPYHDRLIALWRERGIG